MVANKKIVSIVLSILLLSIGNSAKSQVLRLQHKYYTSYFSESYKIPIIDIYVLRKDMVNCINKLKRTNKFTPDYLLSNYTNLSSDYARSGYDRGHNMPAEDNTCDLEGMTDCFDYSNMVPQDPGLNRGIWKELEIQERNLAKQYDSVKVIIGSIGVLKRIGFDGVVVPYQMFKIIQILKTHKVVAYLFKNNRQYCSSRYLNDYAVSLTNLNKILSPDQRNILRRNLVLN